MGACYRLLGITRICGVAAATSASTCTLLISFIEEDLCTLDEAEFVDLQKSAVGPVLSQYESGIGALGARYNEAVRVVRSTQTWSARVRQYNPFERAMESSSK